MGHLNQETVKSCKQKLLEAKMDLLNRLKETETILREAGENGKGGDEADQSSNLMTENEILTRQARLRHTLQEIELALHRIDNGSYGICEETEEPIEEERLLAIPWTRLSIEGAEVREALDRRYAR